MYFALIPDNKTAEVLNACCAQAEDPHLTVLFSPDRKTIVPPDEVQALWVHTDQSLHTLVAGLHNFGPPGKTVWALQLASLSWLVQLRARCEALLSKYGIPWDKTWPFNPHLTIGKNPGISLARNLPETLSFDRIELRY